MVVEHIFEMESRANTALSYVSLFAVSLVKLIKLCESSGCYLGGSVEHNSAKEMNRIYRSKIATIVE